MSVFIFWTICYYLLCLYKTLQIMVWPRSCLDNSPFAKKPQDCVSKVNDNLRIINLTASTKSK